MDSQTQLNISSLLEGIPHSAMILDRSFQIVHMNRIMEAMTGYTCQEVAGFHGELVIRSNTGNNRGQLYDKVLKKGESLSIAGDLLNCHRHKVPIQYTIAPVDDIFGARCGLLIIIEDISALISTEKNGILRSESFELIGYSPKMQKVFDLVPLLAQTDASVMITGETGTGKDKIAEIIHKKSARARFPFIKINCGALPPGLLESELFGHVKGAFTGATRNKQGVFELAHRGTLFLTEIGDMPLPLQVKLLSVLDDREFIPVGGEQKVHVDVRIIAATHRPLREQMQRNEFREDLFYRLHVLHVHLPPLREREEDIRALLDHFLQKFASLLGKQIVGFTPDAMQALVEYPYPGNIRELKNIVEYAVNICKKKKIPKEVLPTYIFDKPEKQGRATSPSGNQGGREKPVPSEFESFTNDDPRETWEDIERQLVIDTLKEHSGNRTKSAATLGWGRMKLWRKMKQYGLL